MPFPIALTSALLLELVRFVQTRRDLADAPPEKVLEAWRITSAEARAATDAWFAASTPPPRPDA